MDAIIPEDISYFNFLSDKTHGLLLQNNETVQIEDSNELSESVFTDGNTTWTIGGVPIYLNTSECRVLTENIPSVLEAQTEYLETDLNKIEENADFPIEIPGKGFLTSSGLFLSNDVLLQLNQQNGETPNKAGIEILSQYVLKRNEIKPLESHNKPKIISSEENEFSGLIEIVSVHKCKNCSSLFERYEDIVEHIRLTCKKKFNASPRIQKTISLLNKDENKKPVVKNIFLCGMCDNVGYENLENLKKHMLVKHNLTYTENGEKIEKTDANKTTKAFFQKIVNKLQTEGRKVKCLIKGCDLRFSRVELMMRHHECHVNGERKKFKCPECDKIFFIWRLCSTHMWKCHKIDIGLFTCNFCNNFKSLSPHNLLIHMSTHDSDKLKPFLCAICGKDFKQLSHLKNHEIVHDEKRQVSGWMSKIVCSTCNRVFANTKILKKHIQAVHNKFKPFICNICGHQCARKAMLELHLRQHTGEKPYQCAICDYKTGDHNSLRRHKNRHYGTTNYSCPHCEYQTIQSITFKTHLKRKHPGKDGIYSCKVCTFDTVNEQLYNDHLKEHSVNISNDASLKSQTENNSEISIENKVPNIEDEETQPGLFSSDHMEDMAVDTGGITIPAESEIHI